MKATQLVLFARLFILLAARMGMSKHISPASKARASFIS